MKSFRCLVPTLGFVLLVAPGAAQLTQDQLAAAEVALQALIERGTVPGIDQLSTLRKPDSEPPRDRELPDKTDRILQSMGADVVPGRVTGYLCEAASPVRNERTGEMEERRVCRFDDGRKPVLFHEITVSDSEAVVPISVESVYDAPTANCVPFGGEVYHVRVVRAEGGGWQFAEVLRTVAYDGIRDCRTKPGL